MTQLKMAKSSPKEMEQIMTHNMTQLEMVKKIISLAVAHPEAKINFCVDDDFAAEFGWTKHKIKRVGLTTWIEVDERIYTDEDSAKDGIADMLYDGNNRELSQQDFDYLVDEYFRENSTESISVFTVAA